MTLSIPRAMRFETFSFADFQFSCKKLVLNLSKCTLITISQRKLIKYDTRKKLKLSQLKDCSGA